MSADARPVPASARERLLALAGVTRLVPRGRFAMGASPGAAIGHPIVCIGDPGEVDRPLLAAILAVIGLDRRAVRVAGDEASKGPPLIAFGASVEARIAAPSIAALARDPAAKRALWRSLRPLRRA